MVMEIGLEEGFRKAFSEFVIMQLQLASVFFTFLMGTRVHFYGRTLLHGGAKQKASKLAQSKRSFVVFHAKFAENYRLYSRSHFTKGLELLILLIIYHAYGSSTNKTVPYVLITFSLWFLVGTFLFAPFLLNPSGFEWQKIVDDWEDWGKWVNNRGGIGVLPDKSWETWWEMEQEHLQRSGVAGRAIEILLAGRFLLYQYGLVYHLHISGTSNGIEVSWLTVVPYVFKHDNTYIKLIEDGWTVTGLCIVMACGCLCSWDAKGTASISSNILKICVLVGYLFISASIHCDSEHILLFTRQYLWGAKLLVLRISFYIGS
jgi:callose synthase